MAAESAGLSCTSSQGQTENTTKLENIHWNYQLRSSCRGDISRKDRKRLEMRRKGKVWRGADPGLRGAG